jgi:hypothetical protein
MLDDSRITIAAEVPPLRYASWQRYYALGTMSPRHISSKSSVLRHSQEVLTTGYIPQSVAALREAEADIDEGGPGQDH